MDHSGIDYSKVSQSPIKLNRVQCEYFVGLNKENQNPQSSDDTGNANNDESISTVDQNNASNQNGLTPLNTNTKLSFSGRKGTMKWTAKGTKQSTESNANTIRLYEVPKSSKKSWERTAEIKSLPSLPNTPSPPRALRQRVHSQKKYDVMADPLSNDYEPTQPASYDYEQYAPPQQAPAPAPQQQQSYNTGYYNHYDNGYYYGNNSNSHGSSRFPQSQQSSNYPDWFQGGNRDRANKARFGDSYYNGHGYEYEAASASYNSYNASAYRGGNQHSSSKSSYYGGSYGKYNKAPRFQLECNSLGKSERMHASSIQCKYWSKGAVCKNGEHCKWSHVTKCEDIRKRVTNYKTKPCVDPGRGLKCEYGDRCNFSHPGEALRRPMPIEYIDKQYFRLLLRDCPTNRYPFGIFV